MFKKTSNFPDFSQFLAILDVILSLLLMLAHVCAIETDGRDDTENYTFLHYFYVDYLAKDDCEYANLINSQVETDNRSVARQTSIKNIRIN